MDDWKRIADSEEMNAEVLELKFQKPNGTYKIILTPEKNEVLVVKGNNKVEEWVITTKEKRGKEYKICGLADTVPEIINEISWFELIIGPETKITYWGNKVISRVDQIIR